MGAACGVGVDAEGGGEVSLVGKRNSLQGTFSLVYSGDPALQPRPADLPKDAPDDAKAQRKDDQDQYDAALKACRETGNWSPLVKPGDSPTVFRFEMPRGEQKRLVQDRAGVFVAASQHATASAFLFRATCKDASNWPASAPKLTFVKDGGLDLLSSDIVEFLDEEVSQSVIGELSTQILMRFSGPLDR